jgi:hypothetical protein
MKKNPLTTLQKHDLILEFNRERAAALERY